MRILVTGWGGYLGGRLAQFLVARGGCEMVLGSRRQSRLPSGLPQARTILLTWDSPVELEEACMGFDTVVHMAGMNAEDCACDPVEALAFNALATARLLRGAMRQGVKRFIYLSTAHVYSNPLVGVITEETCPVNLHPYATSHRAGEDAVRFAHRNGDIEGIVIRLSNAFGAPAHSDVRCWTLLVNDLCRQAVNTKQMVLRTSGTQRRDFIALTEVCRAIGHFLDMPSQRLGDGLYNVGGGWSPTVLEMTRRVAERIQVATGIMPDIVRKEDEKGVRSELLEYRIDKLLSTGFLSEESDGVDREIDALIGYCLRHGTAHP